MVCLGERKGLYRVLVGKPRKKTTQKNQLYKEGDTTLDLQEIVRCVCVNRIDLAEDRDCWQAIVNRNECSCSMKYREFLDKRLASQEELPWGPT